MKWTVAGAGALLSLAGVYALVSGDSIIQMERGWATFIAGAVFLGAGVIVMGLAALIGRVDRLASLYQSSLERGAVQFPQAPPAPVHESVALADEAAPAGFRQDYAWRDAPPPPREVAVEPLPTLDESPTKSTPAQAFAPPERDVTDQRPAPLRDFKFVFPPADAQPDAPVEAPALASPPEPVAPVEQPKAAPRISMNWLRRVKESRAAPAKPPESLPEISPEPAPEPAASSDVAEAATLSGDNFEDQTPAAEAFEPEPAPQIEPAAEPVAPAVAEAAPSPEPSGPPEAAPDPFSDDWLERALAGTDEPRESPRFTPPGMRRASAQKAREEVAETLAETARAGEPPTSEPESSPEAASLAEPAGEAAPNGPAPVEIGRYRANDVAYVMFSDGSITAETPAGESYRFSSLIELRAFIERGGA